MKEEKREEVIRLLSEMDEWQLRNVMAYLRSLKQSEDSSEPCPDQILADYHTDK